MLTFFSNLSLMAFFKLPLTADVLGSRHRWVPAAPWQAGPGQGAHGGGARALLLSITHGMKFRRRKTLKRRWKKPKWDKKGGVGELLIRIPQQQLASVICQGIHRLLTDLSFSCKKGNKNDPHGHFACLSLKTAWKAEHPRWGKRCLQLRLV